MAGRVIKLRLTVVIAIGALLFTGCERFKKLIGVDEEPSSKQEVTILVTGQSNGASPAQDHPPYWSQTGRVWVEDFYSDHGAGRGLVLPTMDKPVRSNVSWLYMGDELVRRFGFQKVTIINRSCPGSNSRRILEAYSDWIADGQRAHHPDFVLWIQGESDYHDNFPTDETVFNMTAIIQKAGGRWIVARNACRDLSSGKPWLGSPERVLNAQRRVIRSGLAVQGPDLQPLKNDDRYADVEGAEFFGEGLRAHGLAWFNVLEDLLER